MFKRVLLLAVVCLMSMVVVSAQDNPPDCSPDGLVNAIDEAILAARGRIQAGDDPATVAADLQTTIEGIRANCADETTSPPPDGPKLGWDDYADLPQSRLPDGGFLLGDPEAEVTIVEFLDYACPHCQNYSPIRQQYIDDYIRTGKANYEVRVFPTAGGQLTAFVGEAIACLEEQRVGAFWAAQDMLFNIAINGKFNENTAEIVAHKLGLDYEVALDCVIQNYETGYVATNIELGNALGVQGTPAILLRYNDGLPQFITYQGQVYNRGGVPFEVLSAVIDGVGAGLPL